MTTCSGEQLSALLDYLDVHKDLARGMLRSADGRLRAKRLWHELSQHLNSLGGCVKTVPQWQKVWTDRKHVAKKNAARNRRSAAATGGGEGCEPLVSWEMRVLSIMGEGFGAPETTARVPVAIPRISFEDEIATYTGALVEELAGLVPQHSSVTVAAPELAPEPQVEVQLPPQYIETNQHLASNNVRTSAPARRRRRVNDSIGEKLIRTEEEKNVILKQIKDGILELTAVVKELVELKRSSSTTAVRF